MGDWHISIEGTGVHNNKDLPQDADRMAKKFVEDLAAAGHTIVNATFTSGVRRYLPTVNHEQAMGKLPGAVLSESRIAKGQ